MHINHPIRQKQQQKERIFGALEVAPGVFLWSRFMVKKNARPLDLTHFPIRPILLSRDKAMTTYV